MKKIKAVIFDLDGTLADTLGDLRSAMNEMLVHFGYPERSVAEITSAICYGQREFVKRSMPEALRANGSAIDRCQAFYSECYNRCYNDSTAPYAGMKEALSTLKQNGLSLSVVTNKSQGHAGSVIKKCFPAGTFETVIGHTDSLPTKPDPAGALMAAKIMGAAPDECLFVGDSDIDIKTGQNAGMKTLGVGWGYRPIKLLKDAGADYTADNTVSMSGLIISLAR